MRFAMSIVAPKERKHLSADALFRLVRSGFAAMPAPCNGDPESTLTDALMSAFAMFSLKSPSLLAFDKQRAEGNLGTIYGIEHVPCDTHMRERLDPVSLMVKKLIWSSLGGSTSRMAVLCLMQQRPNPRPVQPETDHRERAKRDQNFHPTRTEPQSRRRLGLLHPAHHVKHKAGTQDKPCPVVCRIRVCP